LQECKESKFNQLVQQRYQLEDEKMKFEAALQFGQLLIEKGTNVEIALTQKLVLNQMNSLLEANLKLDLCVNDYIAFDDSFASKLLIKAISKYGFISE